MAKDNMTSTVEDYLMSLGTTTASTGFNTTEGSDQEKSSVTGQPFLFYIMLSIFVVVGSIGNALAIYVFASLKQKLTSTIFILTLAGTDLLTCVITIPFTIYMEFVEFHVGSDFVCKIFNFLSTTTVPFSAVVMVAIAVDRYMCICHPFHHWMTIQRARIIIGLLLMYVSIFGITICLHYSIHWKLPDKVHLPDRLGSANVSTNYSEAFEIVMPNFTDYSIKQNMNVTAEPLTPSIDTAIEPTRTVTLSGSIKVNECMLRRDYLDSLFFNIFRHMYMANFITSCALVLILYSLIYRYVISQRKKKLRIKSAQCCLLWNARSIESNHESVEITQDIELSNVNGDRYNTRLMSNDEGAQENHNNGSTRKCSISKARIERMRVANIKTCFTLFIVNIVFILAFLPAWLMAMEILKMHLLIFYMHFFYNVCNPLIYAFLNQNFKTELKRILHCGKI